MMGSFDALTGADEGRGLDAILRELDGEKVAVQPSISAPKARLTNEAKAQLLSAVQTHQWTTAREAYGWVWNHCGVRVSYKTVWSFLNSQGLFVGSTLGSRRLKPN